MHRCTVMQARFFPPKCSGSSRMTSVPEPEVSEGWVVWEQRAGCLCLGWGSHGKQQPRKLTFQCSFSPQAPAYEDVPEFPVYATLSKPRSVKQDDSIHYADIQVFTKARERSAAEVKNLQMQNATEYATLNFPRPRLKYDSKNGTLV